MPTQSEIATILAIEMMRKSGVRYWETDTETRAAITAAALEMAALLADSSNMATTGTFLVQPGTAIVFADSTDYSPANSLGARTDQIDLTSLANGAARQSAKVDLGASWAELHSILAALEIAATPTAGNVVSFYWAPSPSGTAGTANPANVTGADGAYAGYSSNLAASLLQLQFIGDFVVTAQATGTVQIARVGAFFPRHRYGSLIVVNNSGAAFHSDAVEMAVLCSPLPGIVDA